MHAFDAKRGAGDACAIWAGHRRPRNALQQPDQVAGRIGWGCHSAAATLELIAIGKRARAAAPQDDERWRTQAVARLARQAARRCALSPAASDRSIHCGLYLPRAATDRRGGWRTAYRGCACDI